MSGTQPLYTRADWSQQDHNDRARLAGAGAKAAFTPLRGRDEIMAALIDAFEAATVSGTARMVIVRASPGMGKTRLLRETLAHADRRGWRTLTVTPDVDSEHLPLGALTDAALTAQPPMLKLSDLAPILSGRDPQYWVTRMLVDALDSAAADRGVLVAVDDLQWLDAGSLSALAALVRGLTDLPIVWLLASRPGTPRPEQQRLLELAEVQQIVVDLPPLSTDAVQQITLDVVGRAAGPQLQGALQRTERIPLLVVELLRGLRDEQMLTRNGQYLDLAGDVFPERYGNSARSRIGRLNPSAKRIAQAGSLFGRRFTLTAALEVHPIAGEQLGPAVDELIREEIVFDDGAYLAFTHDTLREAAEASLPASVLKRSLRAAVRIRLQAGEPVSAVASSVIEAASPGDRDAIVMLREAAEELAPTDASGAATLASHAVNLAVEPSRFKEILPALIPILWMGGHGNQARALVEALAPVLPVEERATTLLTLARLMTESSFSDALVVCDQALALPGVSDGVRVQLYALRALNSANVGDSERLQDSIEQARSIGDLTRDWAALATIDACQSVELFHRMRFDEAEYLIQTALTAIRRGGEDTNQWLPEGLWYSFVLGTRGRPDQALALADEGLADAQRARNAPAIAYWMMARSRFLFDLGRLEDAREQADTVLRLAAELGLGDFANATAGIVVFRAALQTGDNASLNSVRPAMQQMADSPALTRAGHWALAISAMDVDDAQRAFELCGPALASLDLPLASMNTPPDFNDDITLTTICVLSGHHDQARKVLEVATERARLNPDDLLAAAIRDAVAGIALQDPAPLREAVEQLRSVPRPLVLARALEVLERVSPSAEERIAVLEEALQLHESAGGFRSANRILLRLRALGVRRRPRNDHDGSGLSSRERLVVQHLTSGATTKQIAEALMLSPHTVVTHVRHASAKYGVSSRKELAAEFLRRTNGEGA
ncbi:helix-turn-helix transcriptional regulator [Curtobacterium flaccumfaciens pv. flaccumfaciens]|uniref:helix-turn-helix transcriptional regulator n=1 Tax=Curtobacterium flaccumfaciens TaxID=2035 RepID=UPI003AB38A0B